MPGIEYRSCSEYNRGFNFFAVVSVKIIYYSLIKPVCTDVSASQKFLVRGTVQLLPNCSLEILILKI